MLNEFINELDELLHATPYTSVDILPLVQKYTDGKTQSEKSSIKMSIKGLINQYKESGQIDASADFHWQLSRQQPTHGQFFEDPILIRSRLKFEEEYKKKHQPPIQPITYNLTTHGPQSPIAGHDMTIGEMKSNDESEESKDLTKKTLEDFPKAVWYRRQSFIWLIIATLLALAMLIIALT